jgi:signal transduction histidine kinase
MGIYDPTNQSDPNQLRRKAEEILKSKYFKTNTAPTEADLLRLVHELEVHQVELKLQNEELTLARERSESLAQMYTSLYDFAPIGFFTLSKEGTILTMNLIGSKMLGKPRFLLKNIPFTRFIPEKETPAFNQFLEKAFRSKSKEALDIKIIGIGNSLIYAQLTAIVEEQFEDYCLLTVVDSTDKELVLKELYIALEKEVELSHLKSKFISMTSHELRTPLSTMQSSADLMEIISEGVNEENAREGLVKHIRKIHVQLSRLTNIISDVILFEKNSEGKLGYHQLDVDIKGLIIQLAFNQFALNENETKIELDLGSEPVMVKSDPTLLIHVFRNLIENAIKYTPEGSPKPILKMIPNEKSVDVQIVDFGIGIPSEETKFLFNTFFRGSNVGNIKGTGLGLSIVNDLVRNLRGTMTFSSIENQGSTFIISLPLERKNLVDKG